MLVVPSAGSSCATFVGIDPGSTCVGISIMKVDLISETILSTTAYTLRLDRICGSDWMSDLYGDRFRRIRKLKECLHQIFQELNPLSIAVESPFFNRFRPQAYGVLMEVLSAIREAVYTYDMWMAPYMIDPSSVKNAVGAHGAAKKEVIQAMILNLPDLNPLMNLRDLDEHSLDAIAVNYCRFKRFFSKG